MKINKERDLDAAITELLDTYNEETVLAALARGLARKARQIKKSGGDGGFDLMMTSKSLHHLSEQLGRERARRANGGIRLPRLQINPNPYDKAEPYDEAETYKETDPLPEWLEKERLAIEESLKKKKVKP